MNTRLIISLLLAALTLPLSQAPGQAPSLARQVDAVMQDWRTVTAEFLNQPANGALLVELRRIAHDRSEERVRALLLRLGDPEITEISLEDFNTRESARASDISLSGNPKLVLALASALFQEESPITKKFPDGDEVRRVRPLSVRAAFAIRELILNSTAFSPDVAASAKNAFEIGKTNSDILRTRVRAWVTQNRLALETADYAAVKPLQP